MKHKFDDANCSAILGGHNNTISAGYDNTFIAGSGITVGAGAGNGIANALNVNGLWANGLPAVAGVTGTVYCTTTPPAGAIYLLISP